jgi:hypothetical protein
MLAIYVTLIVAALAVCGFVAVFAAMFRHAASLDLPSPGWLDELSLDKYAPLERLFDPGDAASITAHPGCTASMARGLASARRRAACLYLSELTADFNRLFRIGRHILASSQQERPNLASTLLEQWFVFNARVLSLRLRLRLAPLGLAPGRPVGVVEELARLRNDLLSVPAVA